MSQRAHGIAPSGHADIRVAGVATTRDVLDRYTLGSFAFGVLLGLAGASWEMALAIAVGVEAIENPLREAMPRAFPPPGTESLVNHVGDVAAVMTGWALITKGLPEGG